MTPILFYGVPEGCSFGSIVALEWLGLPYRLCRITMPEEVSSEAYRRLNPLGETPSLMTSRGEILSQSLAILNHLGAAAPGRGLSFAQGTPGFDRLNEALAYLNTSYFDAYAPLWRLLEHSAGETEQRVLTALGQSLVDKAHAELEARLAEGPWLLGGQRSLADAYFAGIARWADFHGVGDRSAFPRLRHLYDRLQEDPAVRFAWAIEEGRPAAGAGGYAGSVTLEEVLSLLPQAA